MRAAELNMARAQAERDELADARARAEVAIREADDQAARERDESARTHRELQEHIEELEVPTPPIEREDSRLRERRRARRRRVATRLRERATACRTICCKRRAPRRARSFRRRPCRSATAPLRR